MHVIKLKLLIGPTDRFWQYKLNLIVRQTINLPKLLAQVNIFGNQLSGH